MGTTASTPVTPAPMTRRESSKASLYTIPVDPTRQGGVLASRKSSASLAIPSVVRVFSGGLPA